MRYLYEITRLPENIKELSKLEFFDFEPENLRGSAEWIKPFPMFLCNLKQLIFM